MNDPLSDEILIDAYRQGEADPVRKHHNNGENAIHSSHDDMRELSNGAEALNTLFKRYLERLRFFLLRPEGTWFKDDNHLDDILQEIFRIAFIRIKNKDFQSEGDGSFKRYLYKIASIECKKQDIKRADQPITLSQRFPLVSPLRAVDEVVVLPPATTDYDRLYKKLICALKYLSGEEIRLLLLVNRKPKITYKEIITLPEFNHYKTIDSLKQKVYDIRQKVELINKEIKENSATDDTD